MHGTGVFVRWWYSPLIHWDSAQSGWYHRLDHRSAGPLHYQRLSRDLSISALIREVLAASTWSPWSTAQVECGSGVEWGWGFHRIYVFGSGGGGAGSQSNSTLGRHPPKCVFPALLSRHNFPVLLQTGFFHLEHVGFHVSFGWWGGIGRSWCVKVLRGLHVLPWILPDKQYIWRAIWPLNIPSCCHLYSRFSSISHFFHCIVNCHIPPPGLFSSPCFVVNLHTFRATFSKLDFGLPQISSIPARIVVLEDVLQWKPGTKIELQGPWGAGSLGRISFKLAGRLVRKFQTNSWSCVAVFSPGTTW